jgi:hypothetical protein
MHGGFRIEPGSAARDAERRKKEAGSFDIAPVGIRVSRAVGQKFEYEAGPANHPGEAQPRVLIPAQPPAPQTAAPVAPPAPTIAPPAPTVAPAPSAAAKVWGKLRGWFGSK